MEFKRQYWCRAPDCVDNVARNNSEEEGLAHVEERMQRWASEEEKMSIDMIGNNLRKF